MVEVKMRLRDVLARFSSINRLREAPKVRAKLAFALSCLAGQALSHVRQFEEARVLRQKQLEKSTVDDTPAIVEEKKAAFNKELEELLDVEVVIKADPVELPANFEMDGLVAVLTDWPEFLIVKD